MKPKKSLGQNFLISGAALRRIVEAASIKMGEKVLEVGPGKGALTALLLEAGACVIAVEKDSELVQYLKEKFGDEMNNGTLEIIEGDVLEIDVARLIGSEKVYKVVANIPYYITGQFLRKFLAEASMQPSMMVLLLQREVVSRIIARDGKESLLSLSIKAFGSPRLIDKVSAKSFSPAPKVDSAIIAIEDISRKNFPSPLSQENFFKILHAGFAHKRKLLKRNLGKVISEGKISLMFEKCGIDTNARAEDVELERWLRLSRSID